VIQEFVMLKKTASRFLLVVISVLSLLLFSACGSAADNNGATNTTNNSSGTSNGSSSSSSSPSSAATAPSLSSSTTPYISPDKSFSLSYPANWQMQVIHTDTPPDGYDFYSSDDTDEVMALPLPVQVDPSKYGDLANTYLQAMKATNIQINTAQQTLTLQSGTWNGVGGTATIGGTQETLVEVGLDHNSTTFLLFILAPTTSFSNDDQTLLTPIVNSLAFLS
jgi:hypothetical protein